MTFDLYIVFLQVRADSTLPLDDFEHKIVAKRRVVAFLDLWVQIIGLRFFLDPVSNSFIEVSYEQCLLLFFTVTH